MIIDKPIRKGRLTIEPGETPGTLVVTIHRESKHTVQHTLRCAGITEEDMGAKIKQLMKNII